MTYPTPVATETLALHRVTLGAGARLLETVGHVAPPHIGRPAQHIFGRSTQPFTNPLPDPVEHVAMGLRDGPFDQIMAVDTPSFW
jgi:hypothetical protein